MEIKHVPRVTYVNMPGKLFFFSISVVVHCFLVLHVVRGGCSIYTCLRLTNKNHTQRGCTIFTGSTKAAQAIHDNSTELLNKAFFTKAY